MIYEEKTFILKNGQEAVLRSPKMGEGGIYLDFLKNICQESEFVLMYPEEIRMNEEAEEQWIKTGLDDPLGVRISCFVGEKLAGNCQIVRFGRLKTAHRAAIAISVRKAFWRLGIGTKLMEEMLGLAQEWGVEQVELQYVEGNFRGQGLYEKMGFIEAARVPDSYRLADGTSRAEVFMIYHVPSKEKKND